MFFPPEGEKSTSKLGITAEAQLDEHPVQRHVDRRRVEQRSMPAPTLVESQYERILSQRGHGKETNTLTTQSNWRTYRHFGVANRYSSFMKDMEASTPQIETPEQQRINRNQLELVLPGNGLVVVEIK